MPEQNSSFSRTAPPAVLSKGKSALTIRDKMKSPFSTVDSESDEGHTDISIHDNHASETESHCARGSDNIGHGCETFEEKASNETKSDFAAGAESLSCNKQRKSAKVKVSRVKNCQIQHTNLYEDNAGESEQENSDHDDFNHTPKNVLQWYRLLSFVVCISFCVTDTEKLSVSNKPREKISPSSFENRRRKKHSKARSSETSKPVNTNAQHKMSVNEIFANSLKTSGKRQKSKKLNDLLGAFDTFHFFDPAPVTAFVYPVSRQNPKQGQSSQSRREQRKEPPPQPPAEGRKWPPESVYGLPWSTFRQELSRLGTFMDMPANSPVFAVRLAQAGFLRFPDGAIICFFCGLQRDEWNAGDSPVEIHRRLRGDCPMVTGGECENQPVVITLPEERLQELMAVWSLSGPSLVQGREPGHQQRGVEVADAIGTASQPTQTTSRTAQPSAYSTGRDPAARADLAADGHPPAPGAGSAGAQASAPPDRRATPAAAAANPSTSGASPVSAPAVGNNGAQARDQLPPRMGLMGGDVASANPGAPRGPIFDGTAQPEPPRNPADNISASGSEPRAGQQVVTYQQLGIVTEGPKRPDMAMINSRVGSFRQWPATASHTPLQLAEAGFYYAGYADCGRCFFCGGGLKNWEPVDNAWVEHARWFAKCAYIRQCQGQDFIDVVQELNVDRCPITLDQVTAEINRRRADGERIQEPVVDPAVSSILELGVRQEDINSAVLRVQREGHLVTSDRLLDTLQAEGLLAAGGVDDASSISDSELGQVEELVTENSAIREQRMCKICLDKESCIVFLPCGHLVSCAECSPALKHCPMCRQRVKGRVRAFPA